jgi:hypothetical protein
MLNPVHARITNPRAWLVEGKVCTEDWDKVGCRRLKCIEEIPISQITVNMRVIFAIYCAREVCTEARWLKWANTWLSGADRSANAAYAAIAIADVVADAAAVPAAYAVVHATRAAAYAATRPTSPAYATAYSAIYAARATTYTPKKIDFIALANAAVKDEKGDILAIAKREGEEG